MHLEGIHAGSDFTQKSAETIAAIVTRCIAERSQCILGLSGGTTPEPIYTLLGKMPIDWNKISIFLVDERYVPADHAESNQGMVRESLLKHATIPEAQICFPDTSLPIDECMAQYTADLKTQWDTHLPDLMILGMGPDGHIASLFPPLAEELMNDTRLIAHTTTNQFAVHDRIGLTLNPIAAAGSHVFLIKGEEKRRVWEEMLASTEDEKQWPAKRILSQHEPVTVIMG